MWPRLCDRLCILEALIRAASPGGGSAGEVASRLLAGCFLLTHCWSAEGWPEVTKSPQTQGHLPHDPQMGLFQPTHLRVFSPGVETGVGRVWLGVCSRCRCPRGVLGLVSPGLRPACPLCACLLGSHWLVHEDTCSQQLKGINASSSAPPSIIKGPRKERPDPQGLGFGL